MDENRDPKSIGEVEKIAAQRGIFFTSEDYAQAHALSEQRRTQMESDVAADNLRGTAWWVDRFNRLYPRFLKMLQGVGDVLITATQTLLIAFGVPLALLVLLIVEQQRVQHGIDLFETHAALSFLGAIALVSLNLILELLISYIENVANWQEPSAHEFSFRLLAQRLAYMLGRDTKWKPREKSPALRFRRVLRIVTFSILVLAVAGSMDTVIRSTKGDWLSALRSILFQSSLEQAVTWAGGLLFAVAVVFSAQALAQYVARKVIEVIAIMQSNIEDKPRKIADAVSLSAAMFLYARMKEKQRAMRSVPSVPNTNGTASTLPESPIMPAAVPLSVPNRPQTGGFIPIPDPAPADVPNSLEQDEALSPAIKKGVEWLRANKAVRMSVRAMAEQAGTSPTTMAAAVKYLKGRGER